MPPSDLGSISHQLTISEHLQQLAAAAAMAVGISGGGGCQQQQQWDLQGVFPAQRGNV